MRLRTLWIAPALLSAALCPPLAAAADETRPNIVVLVADDWGFSDVGAFGGEMATPNLDALAQRGMRFSNFHVAASCSPTRAMLLTGVDNHRNGVGNMPETMPFAHEGQPGYLGVLSDRVVTVASLLKDSGYHTYVAGKWHVGKTPTTLPDQRGFERSFIQADSGSDNWEERTYIFLYDRAYWFEDGREAHLPADYYSSAFIVDKTIGYISSGQDGKPFFAYVGFQANHIPVQAPRSYIDKYRGRYDGGWTALRQARRDRAVALGLIPADSPMATMATTRDWDALSEEEKRYEARRMEVYAAMSEAMDFQVGRLMDHLRQSGQYDNTVFVFLSDNGAEPTDLYLIPAARPWLAFNYTNDLERLGDKGAMSSIGASWASAAASPLNTYKFWAGEGGLRTPLIISGIPGTKANQVSPAFAHVTDIVPTLLDVAGVEAPDGRYQGREVEALIGSSLLPVLLGRSEAVHPADHAIGYELSGNKALFRGNYKLLNNMPPVGDGQWHLYDIAADPGEVRNLRDALPEQFQSMQAAFDEYARANGVLPMPEGYNHLRQAQRYALRHAVIPQLKAALPAIVAGLLLLAAIAVLRRRRRAKRS
jgi:arylsulfatase A-like enzyme